MKAYHSTGSVNFPLRFICHSILGPIFIAVGLSISLASTFVTDMPYTKVDGKVVSKNVVPNSTAIREVPPQLLISYSYTIGGRDYEGYSRLPIEFLHSIGVGSPLILSVHPYFPSYVSLGGNVSSSPLFLVGGFLTLLGVLLRYQKTS
jgi:hypothetical protein